MQLRNDVRLLRLDKDRLTRAHQSQKDKVERLERQLKEQAKRIKELERENEQLKRGKFTEGLPNFALKGGNLISIMEINWFASRNMALEATHGTRPV
jgi:predicted RNase H-like nuclease (RuvC/YqgF family)